MSLISFVRKIKNHQRTIAPKTRYVGIVFTLIAWFLIAFTVSLIEQSIVQKESVFVFYFFQSVFMFVFLFLFSIFRGPKFFIPNEPYLIVFRGILGIVAYYLYSSAKFFPSLVDNSVLFNTEAIFVPLILWLVLKIKLRTIIWTGILIGFVGVGIIYYFDFGFCVECGIIGLLAGLLVGIVIVTSSYMVEKDHPLRIGLYQSLAGIVISGSIAFYDFRMLSPESLLFAISSGFAFGASIFLFLDSYYYTEIYVLGCLGYSTVLFQSFFDFTVFRRPFLFSTGLGFGLILLGGLLTIFASYRVDKKSVSQL